MDSGACSDSISTKDIQLPWVIQIHVLLAGCGLTWKGLPPTTGSLKAEGYLSLFFVHEHNRVLTLSCLLFLGVLVLICWWRAECCGTVHISVNITTVTTSWWYSSNGAVNSFWISCFSWRSQPRSLFWYGRCKGSIGRLLGLPVANYFVCLSRT